MGKQLRKIQPMDLKAMVIIQIQGNKKMMILLLTWC